MSIIISTEGALKKRILILLINKPSLAVRLGIIRQTVSISPQNSSTSALKTTAGCCGNPTSLLLFVEMLQRCFKIYSSMPDCMYLIKALLYLWCLFPIIIEKVKKVTTEMLSIVMFGPSWHTNTTVRWAVASELPGMLHHNNKVHIAVNRSADSAIIVDKLLFGHLGTKGNKINEQFSGSPVRLKTENGGSDYKKTRFLQMGMQVWQKNPERLFLACERSLQPAMVWSQRNISHQQTTVLTESA